MHLNYNKRTISIVFISVWIGSVISEIDVLIGVHRNHTLS